MRFRDVFWPFNGKLDESIHPKLYEQGFTVAENAVWTDEGAVEKRWGLTAAITANLPVAINRLALYGPQLLVTNANRLYACQLIAGSVGAAADNISEATVRRVGIRREIDLSIQYVDMAIAGNFTIYVWISEAECNYRIVETVTGTIVATGVANSAAAAVVGVRIVTNGVSALLTYVDDAADTLYARRIDCSGTPSVGTETALVTNLNNIQYDTSSRGAGWALIYQTTAASALVREVVNANPPTLGWTGVALADANFLSVKEINGQTFIAARDIASNDIFYKVLNSTTGATVLAATVLQAAAPGPGPTGICESGVTSRALFTWQSNTKLMRWRTGTNGGALGALGIQYRVIPESKPFFVEDAATGLSAMYQWVRTNLETNVRGVLVLMHFDVSILANMRPVTTAAFGAAGLFPRALLANVCNTDVLGRTFASLIQVAVGSSLLGADEIRATWNNVDRHLAQRYGTALYFSGGLVTQWDGRQLVENGYVQSPHFTAVKSTGGGSLTKAGSGKYNVALVYEEYDDNGEIARSLPYVHVPVTIDAAGDKIICTIEPLTVTLRQDLDQPIPRVELALYITAEDSSGPYFRVDPIGSADANTFNATTTTAKNITAVNPANPTIYTDGGVLENDALPGGGTILFEHKGRLCSAGGEDAEVFYYSQPRVDGEPANFNLAQFGRISGHEITGGASLDDAMIWFTRAGIFRVHGDGPNATGDPSSGTFTDPIPVPSGTGCTRGAASILVTPLGIMFGGTMGIYLLDRSYAVTYFSGPVDDTLAAFPTIRRASYDSINNQIRFLVTAVGDANSRVLVYDLNMGRWSVFNYLSGAAFADAVQTEPSTYGLARISNRNVYVEATGVYSDAGAWYGITITTGDIGFGNPARLQRVKGLGLMIDRFGTGGLSVEVSRDGGAFTAPAYIKTQAEMAALTDDTLRITLREQRGRRWRVRVKETSSSSPDKGFGFVGLNFETAAIGGTARLGANGRMG